MDALSESRRHHNLPALSIQWGPIADVGFVAEIMKASSSNTESALNAGDLSNKLASMPEFMCSLQAIPNGLSYQGNFLRSATVWWIDTRMHMQGKLASKMLESEFKPQPIDECLSCLGDALVHQEELAAVISIYAQSLKGAEVRPLPAACNDSPGRSSLQAMSKSLSLGKEA